MISETQVKGARNMDIAVVFQRDQTMAQGAAWTRVCLKTVLSLLTTDDTFSLVSCAGSVKVEQQKTDLDKNLTIVEQMVDKVETIPFEGAGEADLAGGLNKAFEMLADAQNPRGVILLSNGKGKKPQNLKPSIPVFACATLPESAGDVLEEIAIATGGKYLFVPDLKQILGLRKKILG